MKKNILITLLIVAATAAQAEVNIYSKNGNFRIAQANDNIVTIENGAYEDLLRVVDESNRQNGINSNYLNKSTNRASRLHDLVDIIPIATYTDEYNNYKVDFMNSPISANDSSEIAQNFFSAKNLIERGNSAISENSIEKTGYMKSGSEKRVYFGNGNVAKDILFLGKNKFEENLKKSLDDKTVKYTLEGTYKSINTKDMNQLGITMDEYYSKIQGKSRAEVVEFLKEKMLVKNIEVYRKNDELYTKDQNGKEWRVLWSLEPVSIFDTLATDENKRFKDEIFTRIFTYDSSLDSKDPAGRIIYTKDGSIISEDKYEYNDNLSLKTGSWSKPYAAVEELVKEAKEKVEKGESPSTPLEHYFVDKKKLTEEEFNKKWVEPFKANGEFEQANHKMKNEIKDAKEKLSTVEKEYEELNKKVEALKNDTDWPEDFYVSYMWEDEEGKAKYLKSKSEKVQNLIKDWEIYEPLRSKKSTEKNELASQISSEIPKKYGFYKYWTSNENEKKWTNRVISEVDIIRNLLGKRVQFRGKGKVEGTIDLGEGNNDLIIAEQFTGRYGTNIILGPYSKLKNINTVYVAGQVGSDSGVSISGRASLTMDIDPQIKNKNGELIQHALKDSDKNIVFRKYGALNENSRNDFSIELMTSKISEDSKINMGRKIYYEIDDIKSGSKLDMKIPFISDSIAHTLVDNKELSEDGNSILNVKVKNEIKRLSDSENKVYRSIKNSGKLAELHPTLTTTNKKTTFSVTDDEREAKKKNDLAKYLKEKSAEDILNDLSQFNLNEVDKKEVISKINSIKEGKAIKDITKKENNLKSKLETVKKLETSETYRKMNFASILSSLENLDLSNIEATDKNENLRKNYREKIEKVLSQLDMINLEELKKEYTETNLEAIYSNLKEVKEKLERNDWGFAYYVPKRIEDLKEAIKTELTYNKAELEEKISKIEQELSDTLEKYSHDKAEEYQFLKGKLYYTVREEEALFELKNTLAQLSERNIYSKLNKISKNEISTYTNIPFEINHALSNKKHYARGGFISGRTVQDNFKGNTSTAYGIYEKEHGKGDKIGLLVGGATTKHNEVYTRTLNSVATESSIKGVSAYLGAYYNKELIKNWNWINGIGLQYGKYTINREVKNTYQTLNSKGRANNLASNLYTGLVINYPIHEDVSVQLKGLLSYTAVKQSKVNESGNLALDINSKLYNYLDTELGINFTKVLYGDNMLSSLSAGVYGMAGLSGYKNGNLNAKVDGSSSSFNIKGDKVKKDAVKIFIDYNVQTDEGYNYGLEGTYVANSEENNVKIGVKAGYVF